MSKLDLIKEEIAYNIITKTEMIYESYGRDAALEYLNTLTEEEISILIDEGVGDYLNTFWDQSPENRKKHPLRSLFGRGVRRFGQGAALAGQTLGSVVGGVADTVSAAASKYTDVNKKLGNAFDPDKPTTSTTTTPSKMSSVRDRVQKIKQGSPVAQKIEKRFDTLRQVNKTQGPVQQTASTPSAPKAAVKPEAELSKALAATPSATAAAPSATPATPATPAAAPSATAAAPTKTSTKPTPAKTSATPTAKPKAQMASKPQKAPGASTETKRHQATSGQGQYGVWGSGAMYEETRQPIKESFEQFVRRFLKD